MKNKKPAGLDSSKAIKVFTDEEIKNAQVVDLNEEDMKATMELIQKDPEVVELNKEAKTKTVILSVYFIAPATIGKGSGRQFVNSYNKLNKVHSNIKVSVGFGAVYFTEDNSKEYYYVPLSNVKFMEMTNGPEELQSPISGNS